MQQLNQQMDEEQQEDQYECVEEYFLDCCRYGDYDDVIECLEQGVDITWMNDQLNNCLHMAAANGHLKIIEKIMEYCEIKQIDKCKMINHQNQDGNIPLHWAIFNNQIQAVEYLIVQGSDITIANTIKQTPLDLAFDQNKQQIIDLISKFCTIGEKQAEEFNSIQEQIQDEDI